MKETSKSSSSGRRGSGDSRYDRYRGGRRRNSGSSSSASSYSGSKSDVVGVRLNKCLPSLSRRAADEVISEGRVTVNDEGVLSAGMRVQRGDVVKLDGKTQHWKHLQKAKSTKIAKTEEKRKLVYVKYWKPLGVTSTSDPTDPTNIIHAGRFELFPQRMFTVGRLDKDSTGLILLTSDGRVNNALLDPINKKEKIYEVTLDKRVTNQHLERLRNGVVITTSVQRENGKARDITAKTLPCQVRRITEKYYNQKSSQLSTAIEFTLIEGRNRQIRRMCESLGYNVISLHRTEFCGISLKGIDGPNDWLQLSENEIDVVRKAIDRQNKHRNTDINTNRNIQ